MKLSIRLALCCLFSTLAACANRPLCMLPAGVAPVPPAHTQPYTPAPWSSFDGTKFPYSVWRAHGPAKAVVIMVPGWDGSMADYAALAVHLSANGYTVYGSEQRTGAYDPSAARRGNPAAWQEWVRDLESFTRFVAHREPGRPIFYHGHSFGTIVSLETAQLAWEKKSSLAPKGVILQSLAMPFLIEKEDPAAAALIATVGDARFPQLTLVELLHGQPTGDKQLNCQWLHSQDRLREGYKVRYIEQAAKLGHTARAAAEKAGPPVLALEGAQDNVVAPLAFQKTAYHKFLTQKSSRRARDGDYVSRRLSHHHNSTRGERRAKCGFRQSDARYHAVAGPASIAGPAALSPTGSSRRKSTRRRRAITDSAPTIASRGTR